MFSIKLKYSITLLLCLIAGITFADVKLPKHYPLSFDVSGVITKVDKKRRLINLDGAEYQLHPVYDIFTKRKNIKATMYNLKKGMKIGAKIMKFKGKRVLTKIWILPKNYPTINTAI